MSEWQITLPYRNRSDRFDLGQLADDVAESISDPHKRAVARGVALELAVTEDVDTVGDALDLIEGATPAQRRALLDKGREHAGLPSTRKSDEIERFEAANRSVASSDPMRDARGRVPAICAEAGCGVMLADEQVGGILHVNVRRWFCAQHSAGHEDDMQPWTGPRFALGPGGVGIVNLDEQEAEAERERIREDGRRNLRESERADRVAEAEDHRVHEAAMDEAYRPANALESGP